MCPHHNVEEIRLHQLLKNHDSSNRSAIPETLSAKPLDNV